MGCAGSAAGAPVNTNKLPLDQASVEHASVGPCRFVVELEEKVEGGTLGTVVSGILGDNAGLSVCEVSDSGCAPIWRTRPGDKMVSVNGIVGGVWNMAEQLPEYDIRKCQVWCTRRSLMEHIAYGTGREADVDCDSVCAICMEGSGDPEHHTIELPCEHVFHSSCIIQWFASGQSRCPLCNHDARNSSIVNTRKPLS